MNNFNFSSYLSPFTWRYGSEEMRRIFSEENKYKQWRKIWIALAQTQNKAGLVSKEELADLKKHQNDINIERILELEKETRHDVVASIKEFAEKAKIGGGKIHLGATSMDIVDNADAIRTKEALQLVNQKVKECLKAFLPLIKKYADFPCIGYTHLQPAEPTTLGYRLAFYAQDLLMDSSMIRIIELEFLKGKGFKGAVGTAASYERLLQGKKLSFEQFEKQIMDELGIEPVPVSNQTYPRKIDYVVLTTLASIAQSLYKFAFDLRFLQSPQIGELMEPFGEKQVGSSAMPFKRNPINSEKICSLARYVAQLPRIAWDNASLTLLERTLDDSANRRIILADGFLATDEILKTAQKIINGLVINENRIRKNLEMYAPFAAIEVILLEAVKNGGDRQKLHEELRTISLTAWKTIDEEGFNPILELLKKSSPLAKYLSHQKIEQLINPVKHVGIAENRCQEIITAIKKT